MPQRTYVYVDGGAIYYLAFDGLLAVAPINEERFWWREGRTVEPADTERLERIRQALEFARRQGESVPPVNEIDVRLEGPQTVPPGAGVQ